LGVPEEGFDFSDELKELDMFYQEKDPVFKTMNRVVKRLEKAKIPYAVVGGMAVFKQGHRRATNDVDILLTPESLEEFRKRFVPKYYEPVPRHPRRFTDKKDRITIDFLVTGAFPGSGEPGPISYPDPTQVSETIGNVQVLDLPTLVQLKLAARRYYDFGDVVSLIRVRNLDESFLDKLHPTLHRDFVECLEEKRREDKYNARHGW
jgi:hypothetical protein